MPAGCGDSFVAERCSPGSGSADFANVGSASGLQAVCEGGVRGAWGLAGRNKLSGNCRFEALWTPSHSSHKLTRLAFRPAGHVLNFGYVGLS